MANGRRPTAFWSITVFLAASVVLMVAGQTTAVFDYELAARTGLQEQPEAMTPFGVQVNRAFGAGDTVVYVPLMVVSLVGLWRRQRWSLLTSAAVFGVSAYWSVTVTFLLLFLPGVAGYTNVPGPEIWLFIGVYMAAGFFGLAYLMARGETLLR